MGEPAKKVKAAGGVIWRPAEGAGKRPDPDDVEVLLVHRPRYGDWSFPKGKLEKDETHRAGAVREVMEETGLRVAMGAELEPARYTDAMGRPKVVRYWAMTATGGRFKANHEVDQVRWLRVPVAARRLTYAHDIDVLRSFVATVLR